MEIKIIYHKNQLFLQMKQALFFLFLVLSTFIIDSCKSKESTSEGPKIDTLIVIEESESDSISTNTDSTTANKPELFKAKGAQWKLWEVYFKDVVANDGWRVSDGTYMGMSNSKGVGVLYNRRTGDAEFVALKIDSAKVKSALEPEVVGTAKEMKISGVSLNAMLGTNINKMVDADIQAAIQSADSSEIAITSYSIEEMIDGDFLSIINNDPKFTSYKSLAFNSKFRVINKALRVKGFTATINLSKSIDAKLAAKIDTTIGKISNTNVDLHFTSNGSRKIVARSDNEFYVFVQLVKAKKL
ncbi:hypothetical protein BH09BAC4_BH09BAC4_06180 [soil metagenome]